MFRISALAGKVSNSEQLKPKGGESKSKACCDLPPQACLLPLYFFFFNFFFIKTNKQEKLENSHSIAFLWVETNTNYPHGHGVMVMFRNQKLGDAAFMHACMDALC